MSGAVSQRAMLATRFLPELHEEARRRQGEHLRTAERDETGHPKSAPSGADLDSEPVRATAQAAAIVGVSDLRDVPGVVA